jgi:hypothetical protein
VLPKLFGSVRPLLGRCRVFFEALRARIAIGIYSTWGDQLLKRLGLFIFISYGLSGGVVHAATYYVSKAGSNSNSCAQAKSVSTAKLTLAGGLGCLVAGDTLLVRGGTYNERLFNNVPSGTSWTNKVRVAAYPGESVWLVPVSGEGIRLEGSYRYIEFDGLNVDTTATGATGIVISYPIGVGAPTVDDDADHIRVQNATIHASTSRGASMGMFVGAWYQNKGGHELINLTITGGGTHAPGCNDITCAGYSVYFATNNSLIENCDFSDATGYLIHMYGGAPGPTNNIIRNNRLHNLHYGPFFVAAILAYGQGSQIYGNVIYDIDYAGGNGGLVGNGIQVYADSNAKIYNNTIYDVGNSGIVLSNIARATIQNNIVWASKNAAIVNSGSPTTCDHNLFLTVSGISCSFGVTDNPSFVDAANANFQLNSGSPARGAGTSGQDMGAYEYRGQAILPPAPSGLHIVAN